METIALGRYVTPPPPLPTVSSGRAPEPAGQTPARPQHGPVAATVKRPRCRGGPLAAGIPACGPGMRPRHAATVQRPRCRGGPPGRRQELRRPRQSRGQEGLPRAVAVSLGKRRAKRRSIGEDCRSGGSWSVTLPFLSGVDNDVTRWSGLVTRRHLLGYCINRALTSSHKQLIKSGPPG